MKRGKKYLEAKKQVEKDRLYSPEEAIELAKKTSFVKFDASVEVHLRLGIDPKKGDQQVRGTVILPHSFGKTKKIAAFVPPEKEKEAQEAGAEVVGGKELIDKIKQTSKINFDVAIATPEMMKMLAPIAKILGPKGLMPSPKNETITTDIKKTISELKKGKVSFKNDNTGNVHEIIGKVSMETVKILENYQAFLEAITKAKPAAAKGAYIKSITLCSTMGPGIKVEIIR